jgi:hypothetical protein
MVRRDCSKHHDDHLAELHRMTHRKLFALAGVVLAGALFAAPVRAQDTTASAARRDSTQAQKDSARRHKLADTSKVTRDSAGGQIMDSTVTHPATPTTPPATKPTTPPATPPSPPGAAPTNPPANPPASGALLKRAG